MSTTSTIIRHFEGQNGYYVQCERCGTETPERSTRTDAAVDGDRHSCPTATITAVKTWKGDKATVTVTFPDGSTDTLGGKRAARAQAVVLAQFQTMTYLKDAEGNQILTRGCAIPAGWVDGPVAIWGLRADLMKAQAEARSFLQPNRKGGRQTALYAEAIEVVEA